MAEAFNRERAGGEVWPGDGEETILGCKSESNVTKRATASRGFTLIELLFVVAIVLIISSMAVLKVSETLKVSRLQASATAISGAIQSTRMRAVATGIPFKLTFKSATSTYQVANCPACSMGSTIAYGTPESAIPFSSTPSLKLSADAVLYFHPDGSVQAVDGTIDCANPAATMTLSYVGLTRTIKTSCYGKVTVSQ